jgi:hypothetical protein
LKLGDNEQKDVNGKIDYDDKEDITKNIAKIEDFTKID